VEAEVWSARFLLQFATNLGLEAAWSLIDLCPGERLDIQRFWLLLDLMGVREQEF
jgi:hypothetical protein